MTMKPVPVLDTGRLAVGLTSREMLEAVVIHTQRTGRPLMLLASRNQVERADLGGGYVSGMTPEAVMDFLSVRRAGNILVCRDHGGPYLRDSEKGCPPEESMERACASVRADVEAGFDIIHLDVHAAQAGPGSGDRYECLAELVQTAAHSAKGRNKPLFYEVGTDGNDGTPARPETVREDLARILAIVHPLSMWPRPVRWCARDARPAASAPRWPRPSLR